MDRQRVQGRQVEIDRWTHGKIDKQTEGQTDGTKDGWVNEHTDRKNIKTFSPLFLRV